MLLTIAGLGAVLLASWLLIRDRERIDALIVWGAMADLGLVLLGLGEGSAAALTGALALALFQGTARLLAWTALADVAPNRACPALRHASPKASSGIGAHRDILIGVMASRPRTTLLLAFGLVAALGVSPFLTLEGRGLILHALGAGGALGIGSANGGPDFWGLVIGALIALPATLQIWLTGRALLNACFATDDLPLSAVHPDAASWPAAPLSSHFVRSLGLAALLVLFGLARESVMELLAALTGADHGALPHLESPWPWGASLMLMGAFPLLCPRLIPTARQGFYAVAVAVGGLLGLLWSDFAPLATFFATLVTVAAVLICLYSTAYIKANARQGDYYFLLLTTFAALFVLVTARAPGTFITGWELMTWASFLLIAWERRESARSAALTYLIICGAGACLMMPGIYALAACGLLGGTLANGGAALAALSQNAGTACTYGFAALLAFIGFAAKAGLVPLHGWLPVAHPAAPSSVSAPLSGILTKAGVFGLVLLIAALQGISPAGQSDGLAGLPGRLCLIFGLLTMIYGEIMALRQDDIKRLLAYSTLGQVGEIVTVLGLGTWLATNAALAHTLNHAIMKDLLFLAAGALILRTGSRRVADLAGLSARMPWTVGCMAVGLVSIMGLPPFNGFASKYLMIVACLEADAPLVAVALLAASLVGVVYYLRILRVLLLDSTTRPMPDTSLEVAWAMRLPLLILAGLCLLLGVAPQIGLLLVTPVADALSAQGAFAATVLPAIRVSWPIFVLVPVLGALVPVLLRHDARKAALGSAGVLGLATLLVLLTGRSLDTLSFTLAMLIPSLGALNLIYGAGYMSHSHTQWRFYAFFLVMTGGLTGAAASEDLFSFFTFWEIMSSWALYFAIAHEGTAPALREAFKYVLFNMAGAACLFLGIGIVAGQGGAASFASIAPSLLRMSPDYAFWAMTLFAVGFLMKGAQVSLRIDWQMHPNFAPTPVSGYISSVLLKIAVFGLVKLFFAFWTEPTSALEPQLALRGLIMNLTAWAGAFTLFVAAVQAMRQDRIKMVFIWSTVSQIGYMVLGVGLGSSLGVAGGLSHLIGHMFFKDLLFFMAGAVMLATHRERLDEFGGLGRRMPVTMGCFAVAALAAVGVPPTSGFTSKWLIYQGCMEQGEILLALIALMGSVVTLAYLARFMHVVFLGQPGPDAATVTETPGIMLQPMRLLAFITVLTGIFPGLVLYPINAMLRESGLAPLDVALSGVTSGMGAWNATLISLLIFVALGGVLLLTRALMARVPERRIAPHACGLDVTTAVGRMDPAFLYPALNALLEHPFCRSLTRWFRQP